MNIIEKRILQAQRELDAYNRMADPAHYVLSGQMDRDREAGKIGQAEIIAISDALVSRKRKGDS